MKCPKCGSELDTGFNCPNCDYKRYEVAVSKTELTPAEMQEWLLLNGYKLFYSIDSNYGIYNSKILKNGKVLSRLGETIYIVTRLVYEWAKQEVTE